MKLRSFLHERQGQRGAGLRHGRRTSGIQHTDAVSKRLRVLALDPEAVATLRTTLQDPAVRTRLATAIPALPESPSVMQGEEDVPPMIAGIIDQVARSFNVEQITRGDGQALLAALDADDDWCAAGAAGQDGRPRVAPLAHAARPRRARWPPPSAT